VAEREKFKAILIHWEACRNINKCTFTNCNELTEIMKHYEKCVDEYCVKCCPTRWLAAKSKLNQIRSIVN
jgi:hypothetical protein